MQLSTSTFLLSVLPLAVAQSSSSPVTGTVTSTFTGSSSDTASVSDNSSSTTPGFVNHSTTPGGVPVPPVTPSVIFTTTIPSANYSASLTVPTTATVISVQSISSAPTQVVITTTANGQTSVFTSLQVVTAGPPTNAGNTAASRPSGTLQNGASLMQSSVQAAAVVALFAVCGIMGTL